MILERKFLIIAATAVLCLLAACSSPKGDAEKAAEQFCNCETSLKEKQDAVTKEFLEKFDDYKFENRTQAEEKLKEMLKRECADYEQCWNAAISNYQEMAKKYGKDQGDVDAFNEAFTAFTKTKEIEINVSPISAAAAELSKVKTGNKQADRLVEQMMGQTMDALNQANAPKGDMPVCGNLDDKIPNMEACREKINGIISSRPDFNKVKEDLVAGRKRLYVPERLERKDFYFTSTEEITKGNIIEDSTVTVSDNQFSYVVSMELLRNENRYNALVKVFYSLETGEENWKIDHIETLVFDLIPTNKYNKCVKVIEKDSRLYLQNTCDLKLLVEGKYTEGSSSKDFAIQVDAYSDAFFNGNTSLEYTIERVEKP